MTSSVPINNMLQSSSVQPVSSVAKLEKALKEHGFSSQLKSWANLTSAAAANYAVSAVNNPLDPTTKGRIVIEVYCEKTPKLVTVPNWTTAGSNPLRWQYKLLTNPPEILDVIVNARDTIRLEVLVGSCLNAVIGGRVTDPDKPDETKIDVDAGRISLGLIFRYKESERWAILVAHAFDAGFKVSSQKGVKPIPLHGSNKNFLLACSASDNKNQCENCVAGACADKCKMKKFVIVAKGTSGIYRTLDANIFDLAIAKIPDSLSPAVQPLNVMDFAKFFQNIADKSVYDPLFLQSATEAMKGFKGFSKHCASHSFLQKIILKNDFPSTFMFKKGFKTGWTWGLLYLASEKQFSIISPVPPKQKPVISDSGDCGATWFIVDQDSKTAVPVGQHCGRSTLELTKAGEDVEVEIAFGQPYYTAFSDSSEVEGLETIGQISGFKSRDVTIRFEDSFTSKE
ncbi:hypothetical protein QBC38DRAFT_546096 [Podospora fimiseda]|uniref:Uncharacterized protein n=1 Tax=Podospora fimiseda TaxID=252190 RepID=A0AAN7BNN0_9PEZI|nr:hypothetical protein QBC38DRAFT_546096 [Podospora fimiseda]